MTDKRTNRVTFETDCRECPNHVSLSLPIQTVENQNCLRVRCGKCETTNYIRRSES